jgi:hypothetical protein
MRKPASGSRPIVRKPSRRVSISGRRGRAVLAAEQRAQVVAGGRDPEQERLGVLVQRRLERGVALLLGRALEEPELVGDRRRSGRAAVREPAVGGERRCRSRGRRGDDAVRRARRTSFRSPSSTQLLAYSVPSEACSFEPAIWKTFVRMSRRRDLERADAGGERRLALAAAEPEQASW